MARPSSGYPYRYRHGARGQSANERARRKAAESSEVRGRQPGAYAGDLQHSAGAAHDDFRKRHGSSGPCGPTGCRRRSVGGSEGLDLEEIIRQIGRDEINELHVEAGATLSGALLDADLVDEIVCYLAPAVMGEGMPFAKLGPFKEMSEVLRGRFVSFEKVGDDLEVVLRKN